MGIHFLFTIFFFLFLNFQSLGQMERCNTSVDMDWLQNNASSRYQRFIDLENFTQNFINNQGQYSNRLINGNGVIVIPVVIHVLHRGEAEGVGYNISMATIQSQIDVLNEDFRRLNADAINTPSVFQSLASDFGIEFKLACIDPNGNSTNGVVRKYTPLESFPTFNKFRPDRTLDDEAIGIKTATNGSVAWDTERYLNIWVCNVESFLGYATWPADYIVYPQFDGIVIHKSAFGRNGGTFADFNKGRTATHEVGHWLNLRHVWGDPPQFQDNFTCIYDDNVGDTPQQKGNSTAYSSSTPTFPDLPLRCSTSDPSTMFMNYMDYVNDNIYNMFTNGQKLRTRALFASGGPREQQLNNWFKVRQIKNPIRCTGIIYSSPACLSTSWTLLSGPATLTPGPGVNQATLQATGTGDVSIRAISGNYISEEIIQVTNVPPPITGTYQITSNYHNGSWSPLGPYNQFFLPVNQTAQVYISIAPSDISSLTWTNSGSYPVTLYPANNGYTVSFVMTAGSTSYSTRTTIANLNSQSSCGAATNPFSFTLVATGGYGYRVSPNPVKDNLNITLIEPTDRVDKVTANSKTVIELVNLVTKQKIKQWNFESNQKEFYLNTQGLIKGTYLLILSKGNFKESKQIIIEE